MTLNDVDDNDDPQTGDVKVDGKLRAGSRFSLFTVFDAAHRGALISLRDERCRMKSNALMWFVEVCGRALPGSSSANQDND